MFELFRAADVKPARPEAAALGAALTAFLAADAALETARENVPSYTAQWSDADYYAEEQEAYNRACEELADAIKAVTG